MSGKTSDQILVPLSKVKIVLILLGSVVFVGIGVWIWTDSNDAFSLTVAAAGGGFFGLCGLYALLKLFDAAPGLIIDAEGIVDNSSGTSAGRIRWSEIRSFKVTTVSHQRLLTIELQNPETYIQRANFLKRRLLTVSAWYFGGPVHISANALKINFDELITLVTESYAKYRRA